MKIVINVCHGGFGLSDKALEMYRAEVNDEHIDDYEIERNDPVLVNLIEQLGVMANTRWSELKVVEIPDGIDWIIQDYDGLEWVAEAHQTWR